MILLKFVVLKDSVLTLFGIITLTATLHVGRNNGTMFQNYKSDDRKLSIENRLIVTYRKSYLNPIRHDYVAHEQENQDFQ